MFLLKPSTEIGDHHNMTSDRVPRVALLGYKAAAYASRCLPNGPAGAVQSCWEE